MYVYSQSVATEFTDTVDVIGRNSPNKTVWWMVDLGEVYNIYSVNIMFKNYDGYGMNHKMNKSDISHKTMW